MMRILFNLKFVFLTGAFLCSGLFAQPPGDDSVESGPVGLPAPHGDVVPREVREITDRGLQYLMQSQNDDGGWTGGQAGPGPNGLALLAFLASGEDPNFGLYSSAIRKGLRNLINSQNAETGYIGSSMYHHGFAMLALAEAYGAVDESDLWSGTAEKFGSQRSIGEALELAVRCAITSQEQNPYGAWRYAPTARDADTSVSGAVLVGLLAARNAGIEVPDQVIDKAVKYYISMTSSSGSVGYANNMGMGESTARSSIACLVFSIAKRKDLKQFEDIKRHLITVRSSSSGYLDYTRYYQAQALFQADVKAWEKWNRSVIREIKAAQQDDGSISGQFGTTITTAMSLLALALNYKFLPIYER
jgi:hypothetical protein